MNPGPLSKAVDAPRDDEDDFLPPVIPSPFWKISWRGGVAFLVGLFLTGALVLTSQLLYINDENNLLKSRANELGLVLGTAITNIQTPLASATELANETNGDPQKFAAFMAPYVGPGKQFASASLWSPTSTHFMPKTILGLKPILMSSPAQAARFFAQDKPGVLNTIGLLQYSRIGYEYKVPNDARGYAIYIEDIISPKKAINIAANSGFSNINFALYFGKTASEQNLLAATTKTPLPGHTASDTVPFGNGNLTIVATAKGSLGGTYFQSRPWVIAFIGVLFSFFAMLLIDRIEFRKERAEQLATALNEVAAERSRLYKEQKSVAQTLQRALLPELVAHVNGLEVSASYIPASSGVDVGGDWYDLVKINDDKALLIIGDIAGHGISATTAMASLRHSALAYASQDPNPAAVLAQLAKFVHSEGVATFGTVLCALLDREKHQITISSAGHLMPLIMEEDNETYFVEGEVGLPMGVDASFDYPETTITVRNGATIIAFTDGLVERRGESITTGLERLKHAAQMIDLPLKELLDKLFNDLSTDNNKDDTTIIGVCWHD